MPRKLGLNGFSCCRRRFRRRPLSPFSSTRPAQAKDLQAAAQIHVLDANTDREFENLFASDIKLRAGGQFRFIFLCALASMYPASNWNVLCSGPLWISARIRAD